MHPKYILNFALCIPLLLCTVLFVTIPEASAQNLNDAYEVRTFDLDNPEVIEVNTSGGFIRVFGSDRDDVQVEMYVRQRNRYLDPSDTDLEDFDIDISQNGSTVIASARSESGGWRFWNNNSNISVSFIIRTPSQTRLDAQTSGGSMLADNISGDIQMRTSGGAISMSDINGNIDSRTSGGNISIENSIGAISSHTSGGSISVDNARGEIDLRTSGGSIRLNDLGGSVNARTSGGSISARMIAVSGDIELRTSGGNITIDLPADGGYELDLNGNSVRSDLSNFSGEISRGHLSGTVNNGGHFIRARTSGGSVRINAIQQTRTGM